MGGFSFGNRFAGLTDGEAIAAYHTVYGVRNRCHLVGPCSLPVVQEKYDQLALKERIRQLEEAEAKVSV